jgi:hypothetical protein
VASTAGFGCALTAGVNASTSLSGVAVGSGARLHPVHAADVQRGVHCVDDNFHGVFTFPG